MQELYKYLDNEWNHLNDGVRKSKHQFHLFTIATIDENKPEQRTVVLRGVNKERSSIYFHTDKRSPKLKNIESNNMVSALFYDSSRRVQLRINCFAYIEKSEKALIKIWNSMRAQSKLCYMGPFKPSEQIENFTPNLPRFSEKEITKKDEYLGLSRFCRVRLKVNELELLKLNYKGHKRMKFIFGKSITCKWIAS